LPTAAESEINGALRSTVRLFRRYQLCRHRELEYVVVQQVAVNLTARNHQTIVSEGRMSIKDGVDPMGRHNARASPSVSRGVRGFPWRLLLRVIFEGPIDGGFSEIPRAEWSVGS